MNLSNSVHLVRNALSAEWRTYKQPLAISEEDLSCAITIFAKLALERAEKEIKEFEDSEAKNAMISQAASDQAHLSDGTIASADSYTEWKARRFKKHKGSKKIETLEDRINKYVARYNYAFREMCEIKLPFAQLQNPALKLAIKDTIETFDDIIVRYLKLTGSSFQTEEELDKGFNEIFQNLSLEDVMESCARLKEAYLKENDNDLEAGFYFLWLLKKASTCRYGIPQKGSFDTSTVTKVLTQFINGPGEHGNAIYFLNFFLYSYDGYLLYESFLDEQATNKLINFAVFKLCNLDFDAWPNKGKILTNILKRFSTQTRTQISEELALSTDDKTKQLGNHLSSAFKAITLTAAIPHFYGIKNIITSFTDFDYEFLFRRPFIDFRCPYALSNIAYSKRLNFANLNTVFIHNSLIIGVYKPTPLHNLPSYLLAYDMNTEKMVWGIPLTNPLNETFLANSEREPSKISERQEYYLSRVGSYISIQFNESSLVHYIHPETGDTAATLNLPEAPRDQYDDFHISQNGYAYQMVMKDHNWILIGGSLVNSQIEQREQEVVEFKNQDNIEERSSESKCTRFFNTFASLLYNTSNTADCETKTQNDLPLSSHHSNSPSFFTSLRLENPAKLQWKTIFQINLPHAFFLPLSTHCGFFDRVDQILIVIDPLGKQWIVNQCISAKANNDKLYTLEYQPREVGEAKKSSNREFSENIGSVYLVIRSLLNINQIEKRILIKPRLENDEPFSIKAICENNQVILFTNGFDRYPIFINIETEEFFYSDHRFHSFAKIYIKRDTAEIWTWDEKRKNVYKVTSRGITLMGSLESCSAFLHVDQDNHLYFI